MCLNRPKFSETKAKPTFIKVGENTNNSKYDFLRLFYTKWNQITKPSPRIIIDTHAGTGLVNLFTKNNLFQTNNSQLIYGSPLLALIKTLKLSHNLKIILNELDPNNHLLLEKIVKVIKKKGLPIFEKITEEFIYKSLQTNRRRKKKQKKEYIFPESFDSRPPLGFNGIWEKTKAEIIFFKEDIEVIMNNICINYLNITDERTHLKPKVLFFVDPCGSVSWNEVIKKICHRSNKQEGTDLILNWSWEAINRTINTDSKKSVLSTIYGIPIKEIDKEFEGIFEMEDFLNKYRSQLKKYFKYVVEVGIPRDRKIKPRQSRYKKYFLILCTNNLSALSLAGYQIEKINIKMRGKFKDMNTYIYTYKG